MTKTIRAWAAPAAGKPLEAHEFTPGPLADDEVEVAVEYCGICHSDLSMIDNAWGFSRYPQIPGHEAVGRVVALGRDARALRMGQRVGVGWAARSCLHCSPCIDGEQHLCASTTATITNRGGFAERLRCQWLWAVPLPDGIRPEVAGPLFCGGITVFAPLFELGISPTARVGVAGRFDLLVVTTNHSLDWPALTATLGRHGRMHFVGAILEPVPVSVFALMGGQKTVSASPIGSPAVMARMLDFCARHGIEPQVEHFPMSRVNDALDHLRAGRARYRIVLDADWPS